MDTREIHAALFDPRGPAGEPSGQWTFVGDARCFDAAKFASFIQGLDLVEPLLVAVSRTNVKAAPIAQLAAIVPELLELGELRMSDVRFRTFVQVAPTGVARAWSRRSGPQEALGK